MTGFEYLTLEDLVGLVRRLDLGPVRDLGLLDAAIARPQSSAFGEDAYPTVKLTVFLDLNGEPVDLGDDDAFQLVLDVAEGRTDVEEIADRLITSKGARGIGPANS